MDTWRQYDGFGKKGDPQEDEGKRKNTVGASFSASQMRNARNFRAAMHGSEGTKADAQRDNRLSVTRNPSRISEDQHMGRLVFATLFGDAQNVPNVIAITSQGGQYSVTLPLRYIRIVGKEIADMHIDRINTEESGNAVDAIVSAAETLYRIDDDTAYIITCDGSAFVCDKTYAVSATLLGVTPNDPDSPIWSVSGSLMMAWRASSLFVKGRHELTVPVGVATAMIGLFAIAFGIYSWFMFIPQFAEALGEVWIVGELPLSVRMVISVTVNVIEAWGLFLFSGKGPRSIGIAASAMALATYTSFAIQHAPGEIESQIAAGIVAFFLSAGLEAFILHAIAVVVPLLTLVPSSYLYILDIASDSMRRWAEERDHRRRNRML